MVTHPKGYTIGVLISPKMPYCKSCETEVGPPQDDLHDPDNHYDIVEGGVNNEDAHLIAREGKHGPRIYCGKTGQTTAIIEDGVNILTGEPVGEGSPSDDSTQSSEPNQPGRVLNVPEEKSQMDIFEEIIDSPHYGLTEQHKDYLRGIAEDYDGRIPPDVLEEHAKLLNDVAKQTASLIRKRYELKLNRWMRKQSEEDEGPPIGVTPTSPNRGSKPSRGQSHTGELKQEENDVREGRSSDGIRADNLRDYRRKRRTMRRNNAADIAAEEAAKKAASEVAGEFAQNFGRYFSLPAKILEAKAEKDPDWFFEKLEEWDINIDEILEPSESRKEELSSDNAPQADIEVDEAIRDVAEQEEEYDTQTETNNTPEEQQTDETPMDEMLEDEEEIEEPENEFEEVFGPMGGEQ